MFRRLIIAVALLTVSPAVFSQTTGTEKPRDPVTRNEVRRWLAYTQDNVELSAEANRDLIAEIERRGVNFALSHEEEWSFTLLEASDELLEAIRNALPESERQAILDARAKRDLYNAFTSNLRLPDLQSRRAAYAAGQEFVRRFASDPTVRDQINNINRNLPFLDRSIKMLERTGPRIRGN